MFDRLTDRLKRSFKSLRGQARLTEDNIKETLHEVQTALLEADVALSVAQAFIESVRAQAVGQEVLLSLSPGEAFVKIVHSTLIKIMGEHCAALDLATQPPVIILLVGPPGSGKTTTAAKLARWIKEREKKSVLVTSTDIYRPAAITQLEHLSQTAGVAFHFNHTSPSPLDSIQTVIQMAKVQAIEVVIIDSAAVHLLNEDDRIEGLKRLQATTAPAETLLVVDGMSGQDAAITAQAFGQTLQLTGVILTKMDSDTRGGAALSVRFVTQKPIKFIGNGETSQALEAFYPDRIASRILGMGDIVSLVEDVQRHADQQQVQSFAAKIRQGREFNLEDLLKQLLQMKAMGGMTKLLDKFPKAHVQAGSKKNLNDAWLQQAIAILRSMTLKERRFPALIRGSRKQRITVGSGTQPQDINRLLKQFEQMKKTMKRFKGGDPTQKFLGQLE